MNISVANVVKERKTDFCYFQKIVVVLSKSNVSVMGNELVCVFCTS